MMSSCLTCFLRQLATALLINAGVIHSLAVSAEQPAAIDSPFIAWQGVPENPVFKGRPGRWDAEIRERGWILQDKDVWKLWYTGYNREQQPVTMKLGYATSPDGRHWKRWSEDPIYDDVWIEDMMIVRHDGKYFMFAEGARDQAQLLESHDGIHWTRRGQLDVRRTNGDPIEPGPYGTPTGYFKDGIWYLFYERRDAGIWIAQSTDIETWTNIRDDPVIVPGPGKYDAGMVAMNQVIHVNDRYYAVLHGTGMAENPRFWCTYLATSPDLLTWNKLAKGPVLPISGNKSSGVLVPDGRGFRLYTMHVQVDLWLQKGRD